MAAMQPFAPDSPDVFLVFFLEKIPPGESAPADGGSAPIDLSTPRDQPIR